MGNPIPAPLPACFYCEQPAGSNEHMLPDWVCRYLFDHQADWSFVRQSGASPLQWVENVGDEIDITTDLICDRCNRGWMRKLEDRTSTFLKPMLDGSAATVLGKQRSVLARWVAKTITTFECDSPGSPFTPQSVRRYIHQHGVPPAYEIFMGHYVGPRIFDRHRRVWSRSTQPEHVALSTLLIGKVLFYVFADPWRAHQRPISRLSEQYLMPLVADMPGDFNWPPPMAVDEVLLVKLSDADWIGLPPLAPQG